MSVTPLPSPVGTVPLGEAVAWFLERYRDELATATTYGETLAHLLAVAGDTLPVAALTPELCAAVMQRWDQRAPATWNKHLAALRSLAGYALRQEWIHTDPTRHLERRKTTSRGDKTIPTARLDKLFTDERTALRERVLWRMLYETAARAEEVLTLDVTDLDPEFRRAVTRSKGGDREYLHWATATARLLPHLLAGRTTGPVFLADRRSPSTGNRARALADVDPATGRGRLSYPRAEYLFKQTSMRLDPHGIGWTLHQLRHSALGHLAASGRTAPELQAKSRHKHLATLGHYVRLGEETSARITAEHDTHNRRRIR
jgi:site-specific recombinase XerD